MVKRKPSMSERMAEALKPATTARNVNPFVPTNELGTGFKDIEGRDIPAGAMRRFLSKALHGISQPEIDRAIAETAKYQAKPERVYGGYKKGGHKLPVGNGQNIYLKSGVTNAIAAQMNNDAELKALFTRGFQVGGDGTGRNQQAFFELLESRYHLLRKGSKKGYQRHNQYFDWSAWKAEYVRLKG